MIALCPPINGIKSEFMPDRHENGRPTLSRFDMKSDRYCVEPVSVRGGVCAQRSVWHASLPRVKHKRGTLAVKTMAGKILVTLAVKMKVVSHRLSWGHLRTQRWQKSSAHWRLKRGVVAWKTCLFTLKKARMAWIRAHASSKKGQQQDIRSFFDTWG